MLRVDHCEVLQLLIEHGANLECTDLHFGRPLHLAALKGHVHSAKVLLLAGQVFICNYAKVNGVLWRCS